MTTFSSLFQSGTAFYGDPFPPIIDIIQDWGWSLLPQFPGSYRDVPSGGGHTGLPPAPAAAYPEVPVAVEPQEWVIESETTYVPEVLPGSVGTGGVQVPTEVVRVEDVSTEVEHYEEGDFPAGSIFAPGRTWGNTAPEFDYAEPSEEPLVAWGDILDWGLDTLAGQQPWQTFGQQNPADVNYFAAPNVPAPSGIPGQPTTITGYSGGRAVTNGDTCGNRRYVTLDRETGKISCKRRRRRRLLTNRDLADLASLKTITGGGAALNAAVIRAVR